VKIMAAPRPAQRGTPCAGTVVMMSAVSTRPHVLKLANGAPRGATPVVNRRIVPVQAARVAQFLTTTIAPTDPRWVLAARAALSLSGGRAAILIPEKRRALDACARRLGLRPFDASLIIAIVQDAVRRGEWLPDRGQGPAVAARLSLVRPAQDGIALCHAAAWVLALASGLFAAGWFWLGR
jgi:hypothetical protein